MLSCSPCGSRGCNSVTKGTARSLKTAGPAFICKTVSCSPLTSIEPGPVTQVCSQRFRGPTEIPPQWGVPPLCVSSLWLTLLVCISGVPKEETTADSLLDSSCILTDVISPGIIYVKRDCPRVNHYPVLQNSKRLQFVVNGSDKYLEKSFNHLSKVTNRYG